jgi:hypothetical protein
VVFVVGVEKYEDRGSDRLEFVAEDAVAVWESLRRLTSFDVTRSRCLVEDARGPGARCGDAGVHLTRQVILDAFEDFLEGVKDQENVLIYFGGHGKARRGAEEFGAAFLPADYSEEGFKRALPLSALFDMILSRVAPKTNVNVVLFMNACESGLLKKQGGPSDHEIEKEQWKRLNERFRKGGSLAYIPAVPADENAYESETLKASEYAHHLVGGLEGEAAEQGAITSGSLMRHLGGKLKPPPRNPDWFPKDIPIGYTRSREADYHAWLGRTLVDVALPRGPDRQLLRLALFHLDKAGPPKERSLDVALAELRARILRDEDTTEVRQRVEAALARSPPDSTAGREATKLLAALAEEQSPFYGLVLECDSTSGLKLLDEGCDYCASRPEPGCDVCGRDDGAAWSRLLAGRPGHQVVRTITRYLAIGGCGDLEEEARRAIASLNEAQQKAGFTSSRFVLIYTGASLRSDADPQAPTLQPLSSAAFWSLAKAWSGPTVAVFDASHGGLVLRDWRSGRDDLSLWLAATQENGITVTHERGSSWTTEAMIQAASGGLTDTKMAWLSRRWSAMAEARRLPGGLVFGSSEWHGRPQAPFWPNVRARETAGARAPMSFSFAFVRALTPLSLPTPDARAVKEAMAPLHSGKWSEGAEALAPFGHHPLMALPLAGLYEIAGQFDQARTSYDVFLGAWPPSETAGDPASDDAPARSAARTALEGIRETVRRRQAWLAALHRIHLVAEPGDEWVEAFQGAYPGQVNWHRPAESTAGFRGALEEAVRASSPHDLVVVAFRGRAEGVGSERVLVSEHSRLALSELHIVERDLVALLDVPLATAPLPDDQAHPRHLYVWWEPIEPAGSASPFGDLRRALGERPRGMFKDWIDAARRSEPEAAGLGRLSSRGEERRLMMRGGDDLTGGCFVDLVQLEAADIDFSLELLEVWQGVATTPADRLTRGALLLAREEMDAECLRGGPPARGLASRDPDPARALKSLESLANDSKSLQSMGLDNSMVYWHSRALAQAGDPDRALGLVLAQPPEDLASPEMVSWVRDLTEQGLRKSAADRVRDSLNFVERVRLALLPNPKVGSVDTIWLDVEVSRIKDLLTAVSRARPDE